MECLTDQDAFTARELAARGFRAERIAELLLVDEDLVHAELRGEHAEPELVEVAVPEPLPEPPPVDPNAWPPPVDASTVRETVWVREGYAKGHDEQVRRVRLWGKGVQINARNEVWCTYCGGVFHAVAKLGHPSNACPTGIRRPGGVIYSLAEDEMVGDSAPLLSPMEAYFASQAISRGAW